MVGPHHVFKGTYRNAFALPSILIASVVMLIVLVTAMTSVVSTRNGVNEQYHSTLAREAAQSGFGYILSCIKKSTIPPVGVYFTPNATSCTDNAAASGRLNYVLNEASIKTTYSVAIDSIDDVWYRVKATGTVQHIRQSNGDVWKSQEVSLFANINKTFLSLTDFAVVTRGMNMYVIRPDGSLWAWGQNNYGQIGTGDTTVKSTPQQIIANGVRKVAVGNSISTYAIRDDGSLWAWGNNSGGRLGDGTTDDSYVPKQIISSGVKDVIPYGGAVVALMENGSLRAWGSNASGLVGNNSTDNQLTPVTIMTSGVDRVLYTNSNYAVFYVIKTDGSLWAWGNAATKLIGNGSSSGYQATPVRVITSGVKDVATSGLFGNTVALMSDGSVRRWGMNDGLTPQTVSGLSNVVRVIGTAASTYVITSAGALYSWGDNASGTIGNGTSGARVANPFLVFSSGVKDVATTRFQNATLALKTDGTVWAWGKNNYCQLANGTTDDNYAPSQIMSGVASIYAYERGSFGAGASNPRLAALDSNGSLWSWGSNYSGAVGNGISSNTTNQCTPYKVLDNVKLVADSDYYTTYAVTNDFNVWSWGNSGYGQLGRFGTGSVPGQVLLPLLPPNYY